MALDTCLFLLWRASAPGTTGSCPFVWMEIVAADCVCQVRARCSGNSAGCCSSSPWLGAPLQDTPSDPYCDPASAPVLLLFWGKPSHRITCTLALFQRAERCYLSRSLLLAESGLLAWEGIFKSIFLLIIPCIARCSWNFSIFWERNLLIHQQVLFQPLGPSSLCDWNHVFLSCCNITFLTLWLISELKHTFKKCAPTFI